MPDARWLDVESTVRRAVRHYGMVVALHGKGGFDEDGVAGYQAGAALMHAIQSAHTETENALLLVLDILGEARPTGQHWHIQLIDRLSLPKADDQPRPAFFSADAARDMREMRRARHLSMHGYDDWDVARAGETIAAAGRLARSLPALLEAFKSELDGPQDGAANAVKRDRTPGG